MVASGELRSRSPSVLISTSLVFNPGFTAESSSATQLDCQRARRLPRVPMSSVLASVIVKYRLESRSLGPPDDDHNDASSASLLEGPGGCARGSTGRQHIVDQEYCAATNMRRTTNAKCATHDIAALGWAHRGEPTRRR